MKRKGMNGKVQNAGNSLDGPFAQGPTWEKQENPQGYDQSPIFYAHKYAARHIIGIVGGNEASLIKGNQTDLESDLRGINIPNTFCPKRMYLPPDRTKPVVERKNLKSDLTIDTTMKHLPAYQMWAYPFVLSPQPLKTDACGTPERY
jgi:hypothetical protein